MRKDRPNDEVKFITIATKLPKAEAAMFQQWCESRGMNISQAFTLFVQCVMQYQSESAIDNEKLRQVMQLWDEFKDINRVSAVICPGSRVDVVATIYLLSENGKRGTFPVYVEPSLMGEPQYSTNIDEIVDELFTTSVLKGLRSRVIKCGKHLDANGMTDSINAVCLFFEQSNDPIHNEILEEFAGLQRHEWGQRTELVKYKRHNASTVNQMEMQFEDEQGQEIQPRDTELEVDEACQHTED